MGALELLAVDAVSSVLPGVRAQYGVAFDAAIARNVADALNEDVGTGDQTGRLVPADEMRDARIIVREEAVLCGVLWFDAVVKQV
ncbi:MAG: nicotinate-nucleotide diphosphorylase (carboxylating), partial [Paraburkholderia tropica]